MRSSSIGSNRVSPYSDVLNSLVEPVRSSLKLTENRSPGLNSNPSIDKANRVNKPSGLPRSFNQNLKFTRPATHQIGQRDEGSSIYPLKKNVDSAGNLNSNNHKNYSSIAENSDANDSICNMKENPTRNLKEKTTCEKCKKGFKDNIKFLTPKCGDHSYCGLCIEFNWNSSHYSCVPCYQYFSRIGIKIDEKVLKCNLCTMFPDTNIVKCSQNHQYCKKCLDFITKNPYEHLLNLRDCYNCCEILEQMKNKNIQVAEENDRLDYIRSMRYNSDSHSAKTPESIQETEILLMKKQNYNPRISPIPEISEETNLSKHKTAILNQVLKNSTKIISPIAVSIPILDTDFGLNTPIEVSVEENKKENVSDDKLPSNEAGLTNKDLAETKSTPSITKDLISNNAESESLPHPESKQIINLEEIKSNSIDIEKEPTLTLSKSSRREFECIIEGVRDIILALPIVEWGQIKLIDRIFCNQEKRVDVHKAVIFLEDQEKIVAVKTSLSKFKDQKISIQAEYMALVQDHPHFLKLYGAFWDTVNEKQRFTIVMELAFETLTQRIIRWDDEHFNKTKKEEEALKATIHLVEAMTIMNKKDISHRDIKPDNIFITENNVYKIADFDASKKIERDAYGVTQINKKATISGTKHFMSPELNAFSSGIIIEGGIDYNKSDVYSLGLTILRMITKKNFLSWNIPNENLQDTMYKLIDEIIENQQLKKLLKFMLIMDPGERPKFREVKLICHMQEATVRDDDYF